MAVTTQAALVQGIREVTDEEVAFFEEHGWVMLEQLLSRELAAAALEAGEQLMPSEPENKGPRVVEPAAGKGLEPFRTIAFSAGMGRAAHRLINRKRLTGVDDQPPTRFHGDHLWLKEPGADPTGWHQDGPFQGGDRVGELAFWIALDEIIPEMGGLHFLSGSHREGPLGHSGPEAYPRLFELYQVSEPLHYRPGDATVHAGYTFHGAPENATDRRRWSYVPQYHAADTQYIDGIVDLDGKRTADRWSSLPDDVETNPVVFPV